MRKYKKVSQCPSELDTEMYLVNALSNEDWNNHDEKSERLFNLLADHINGEKESDQLKLELKRIINNKIIFNHLTSKHPFSFDDAYDKYFDIHRSHRILLSISQSNQEILDKYGYLRSSKEVLNHILEIYTYPSKNESEKLYVEDAYRIDGKGNVRPKLSGISLIFEKYDISFSRIRICPICLQIFWAKKLNSKTCGREQCSAILSQRVLRDKKKDDINFARRQAYAFKKALEKNKK